MKKKILSIAVCAAMVLSLTACGKGENPFANLPQSSASKPVSAPNNSKPAATSTSAASSAPVASSAPDTSSTPEAPKEIDWTTVPYADEKDFEVKDSYSGVAITKYLGKDTVVNIPPTVGGKKVTSVNLRENQNITYINIPDSVTSIDENAFSDCTSLTSIIIPDSVTEIGAGVFAGCTNLTSINIPDSVTEIGGAAFSRCTSLTSIDIPDGVPYIGVSAFRGCTSLTSINIPDSVTEIGKLAFDGCTSLTSLSFPDSLEWIGASVFTNCPNVKVTYKGKEYDYDHLDSLYSDINGN